MTIDAQRRKVSEEIFEGMDFGTDVLDADGWETEIDRDDASVTWRRIAYLAPEEGDGDSVKCAFKVEFDADSSEPRSATAYIGDHVIEWFPPSSAPEP